MQEFLNQTIQQKKKKAPKPNHTLLQDSNNIDIPPLLWFDTVLGAAGGEFSPGKVASFYINSSSFLSRVGAPSWER